jgi:IclR family acetate operon transcriptional repressor
MDSQSTVEKAVDVLFHLHNEAGPRGVTAIGRALGLPKSSAHRLLAALGRRGLVERDERGRYRPGFGLIALGVGALESEPVVAAARPVLEHAAESLGETCFLVAARAERLIVLDKVEGTGFLRAAPTIGASVPVHATAVGKLFLALDPAAVSEPPEPFEAFSEHTITTKERLAAAIAGVRERGYAESREEWTPGLSVLAAPVQHSNRLIAAVAIAVPSQRYRELGSEMIAERTCAAAQRVEARLEGTGR